MEKSVLTTLTETIRQHAGSFSPKVRKRWGKFIKVKFFPQILFMDFVAEWSIDDPGEK